MLGRADLGNISVLHHDDGVRHGQRLFLVVGYKDESDAQALLHAFQFQLHALAQLEIKGTQRLVKQQYFRFIDQGSCDCYALLLAAGERVHTAFAVLAKINQVKHAVHALVYFIFGPFCNLEAEGNVFIYIKVRKQRILLKYGIYTPLIRREICNILTVKQHASGCRLFKAADDSKRGCFPAPGRTKQGQKLILAHI